MTLGFLALWFGTAEAQVLTPEDAQALDWSGPIPAKLKAATDGIFDEGPDYWSEDPDEWFNESDVVVDRWNFTVSIFNNRKQDLDDLIFLVAYKEGDFSTLRIGDRVVTPDDFHSIPQPPFRPGGNRPGDGESALYGGAWGVVFVRVGAGVGGKKTVDVPVEITESRAGLTFHLDFYGLTVSGRGGDLQTTVECMNAASHDITWNSPAPPSAIQEETWGQIKVRFAR
jgi:hypothetical protein